MNNQSCVIEQKIIKALQWFLGIGFIVIGSLVLAGSNILQGLIYLLLGTITVPVLKLPYGFRTAAILFGAFFL